MNKKIHTYVGKYNPHHTNKFKERWEFFIFSQFFKFIDLKGKLFRCWDLSDDERIFYFSSLIQGAKITYFKEGTIKELNLLGNNEKKTKIILKNKNIKMMFSKFSQEKKLYPEIEKLFIVDVIIYIRK